MLCRAHCSFLGYCQSQQYCASFVTNDGADCLNAPRRLDPRWVCGCAPTQPVPRVGSSRLFPRVGSSRLVSGTVLTWLVGSSSSWLAPGIISSRLHPRVGLFRVRGIGKLVDLPPIFLGSADEHQTRAVLSVSNFLDKPPYSY